jgi:hypothetical protein
MLLGPIDLTIFDKTNSSELGKEELDLPAFLDRFQAGAIAFAFNGQGIGNLRDAWCTFRAWMHGDLDPQAEDWRLFLHWYIFHWVSSSENLSDCHSDAVIAEKYSLSLEHALSLEQKKLVAAAIQAPLDFYETYWLAEWECFYLKSLFLGQERSFAFTKLPIDIKVGDIFFGKIVPLQYDRGILAAHSQIFDSSAKVPIARLRQDLISARKSDFSNNFHLFDADVFNLYHDLLCDHVKDS